MHSATLVSAARHTGSTSGALAIGALARQTDNTWAVKLMPQKEESLTIKLTVGGISSGVQTVVISGRSLSFLALNSSLQQASLVSQALSATSLVVEGALLMAYVGDTSYLYTPVLDQAGNL